MSQVTEYMEYIFGCRSCVDSVGESLQTAFHFSRDVIKFVVAGFLICGDVEGSEETVEFFADSVDFGFDRFLVRWWGV
jgi:hypothetical protein